MEDKFLSFDNIELFINEYTDADSPKAVVQISHDINESADNYTEFAKKLNDSGFLVYVLDQRAHGKNTKNDKAIGVYENDLFYDSVKDQVYLAHTLKAKHKLPLILVGHGFGRFVCERTSQLTEHYDAVIVSGSNLFGSNIRMFTAKVITFLFNYFKNKNDKAVFINTTIQKYNQYKNVNWLCSSKEDKKEAKIYSNNYYYSYVSGLLDIYKTKNTIKMDNKKPIYIFAEESDALNINKNELKNIYEFYNEIGISVVERIYKLENKKEKENLKKQVQNDLVNFINDVSDKKNIKSSKSGNSKINDPKNTNKDDSKSEDETKKTPTPVTKIYAEENKNEEDVKQQEKHITKIEKIKNKFKTKNKNKE